MTDRNNVYVYENWTGPNPEKSEPYIWMAEKERKLFPLNMMKHG